MTGSIARERVNKMEVRKHVDPKSQDLRQAANVALIEVDKGTVVCVQIFARRVHDIWERLSITDSFVGAFISPCLIEGPFNCMCGLRICMATLTLVCSCAYVCVFEWMLSCSDRT